MRVIIAGGRDFDNLKFLEAKVNDLVGMLSSLPIIVSGKARGADSLGEQYADTYGLAVKEFPALWNEYGKSAGYRRNVEMANYADALIAFWDGKSKGTKHMIDIALDKGLLVQVVRY